MRLSVNIPLASGQHATQADVYVAVSDSVAIRVVPVDGDGVQHEDAAVGVVGAAGQPDVDVFLAAVAQATSALLAARGV